MLDYGSFQDEGVKGTKKVRSLLILKVHLHHLSIKTKCHLAQYLTSGALEEV
jgi:hypothetical protein